MNVLIITQVFWPEAVDFKNISLARELTRRGHKVTVLTAFPNYPLGRIYDGYKLSWRKWESVEGIRVLRVPHYPDHSSSGLKRVLNYGSFTLAVSTIGLMSVDRPDVVFLYAPPMTLGFTAAIFKLFYRVPVLMDVVDLWPEAIAGSGMVSSGFVMRVAGMLSNFACRVADKITVPTEGFAARLGMAGGARVKNKISVSPNWADKTVYYQAEKDRDFGGKFALENKFCIIHAGNIGPFQDIRNVLLAADRLRDIKALRIILVGGGRDLAEMKDLKAKLKLDNVIFAGSYPAVKMPGIFAWGDAMLVSLRADPYLAINFPSKIPGYMAAGRPIIACAEGEASKLVAENDLGLCCKPGDPAALADVVRRFYLLDRSARDKMGENGLSVFSRLYDKDVLVGGYVNSLEVLGARRNI
jgi:glycosyltransferase involved in cell wall biosynthesis